MIDVCMVLQRNEGLIDFHVEYWKAAGVAVRLLIGHTLPIARQYPPNVKPIQLSLPPGPDYHQYGHALDALKEAAETEYIIFQDIDFFWLHPNIISVYDSLEAEVFGVGDLCHPQPFFGDKSQAKWSDEFHTAFVPHYIACVLPRWLADFRSFVVTEEEHNNYGYEIGWKVRHEIMRTDTKFVSLHSFRYSWQEDALMCFYGSPARPYGLHYLASVKRLNDSETLRPILSKYKGKWNFTDTPFPRSFKRKMMA